MDTYQTVFADRLKEEQHSAREVKVQEQEARDHLGQKEEILMAKRYVQMTGKAPTELVSPVAPSLARTSVAVSAKEEMKANEAKIDPDKVRRVIEAATAASKPSTPTRTSSPRMDEVRHDSHLFGPIEELRALTLSDFRRLSRDPKEGRLKIMDKIDLLESQGYEKKIAGILAYRASPLYSLYSSLTNEAITSVKSVEDIVKAHSEKKEETLTVSELTSLRELNGELRF